MSGRNGELHPTSETPAPSTPGKRKRTSLETPTQGVGLSAQPQEKWNLQETLRNLVETLNRWVFPAIRR